MPTIGPTVQGPAGDWWLIYHGHKNGFRALGLQTLLEPIEWTTDGWFRAKGGDLSKPLRKPAGGTAGPAGRALSDDFTGNKFGVQWTSHDPGADEMKRVRFAKGSITVAGKGTSSVNCSRLTIIVGDLGYEVTATLDILGKGEGGLLLFYNERAFVGVGFTPTQMRPFNYGEEQSWTHGDADVARDDPREERSQRGHLLLFARRDALDAASLADGGVGDASHNVLGGFLSLKPGIYSAGEGSVRIEDVRYRGL